MHAPRILWPAMIIGCCAALVQAKPPVWLRFAATFDDSVHGVAVGNHPFVAAGNVELIDGALVFTGARPDPQGRISRIRERSALVIDGTNVPAAAATVAMDVQWTGELNWTDGQRSWLMAVVPHQSEAMRRDERGTALGLIKDADNTLQLAAWQFQGADRKRGFFRLSSSIPPPAQIVASVAVDDLPTDDWARVRMGWDCAASRAWLAVDDRVVGGEVELVGEPVMCLLLGTPPSITQTAAYGFDGRIDNVIIDARSIGDEPLAALRMPADLPPTATPGDGMIPATLLVADPLGASIEAAMRSHLANVIRYQRPGGGWPFDIAWPSGMSFLSSSVVIPYTDGFMTGCKGANSSYCALMMLTGYFALEDPACLVSAERWAQTLLRLQEDDGHWPYASYYDRASDTFTPLWSEGKIPLEDHVQSHPVLLLWLLHELTGDEAYLRAAERGRDVIERTQNPNGSWSHHFDIKKSVGQAANVAYPNAGEINDHTTTDQMLIMLMSYRRTGDDKFLASFLRAADWLVAAFIDKAAKGWAQQYDEHNNPIRARSFEPAAVSLSEGTHSAPRLLMRAYRVTGDERYLEPLHRWRTWMMDNRTFLDDDKTKWGWHLYYDIETGEPFRMHNTKRYPPDPAYCRDWGFSRIMAEFDKLLTGPEPAEPSEQRARRLIAMEQRVIGNDPVSARLRTDSLVGLLDERAGTWMFGSGPTGKVMSAATVRVALLGWSAFVRRQLAGQIPWDHRLSRLEQSDWGDPFSLLMPPHELFERVDVVTLERVRQAQSP